MLNPFPLLLSFGLLAPFFLRIILGVTLLHIGTQKIKSKKYKQVFAYIEILCGILFILGLYTQIAAILASLLLIYELAKKIKNRAFLSDGVNYYLILLIIAISLLFSGAGFFAFDLPL